MEAPEISLFGDAAVLATFGDAIDPTVNRRVLAAAAAIRRAIGASTPWLSAIPAYASLLVEYDALRTDATAAVDELRRLLATVNDQSEGAGRLVEIEVRYGGEDGPDLDAVVELVGLSPTQVVEAHSSVLYRAYMLGFSPGFAYLGVLPPELEVPRLETPRQRVPAGSVAIAGRQTAVYPQATPGGWQLIGRTEAELWDPSRDQPALISAGDTVRFVTRA